MWTSICPRRIFVSETIRDVSWTGGISVNLCTNSHSYIHIISLLPLSCSSNRQRVIHGGECGLAGPDGADWHLWPGDLGCLLQLWWRRGGVDLPTARYGNHKQSRDYKARCTVTSLTIFCIWLTGHGNNNNNEEVISNGLFRHVLEGLDAKSRMSSTSSISSSDSQTTNANGGDTPVVRSDDEETHTGTVKRRAVPPETEKVKSQTPSSSS